MLEAITDLPDGVLGFTAVGEMKHFRVAERDAAIAWAAAD